jgi:hypothetical protein
MVPPPPGRDPGFPWSAHGRCRTGRDSPTSGALWTRACIPPRRRCRCFPERLCRTVAPPYPSKNMQLIRVHRGLPAILRGEYAEHLDRFPDGLGEVLDAVDDLLDPVGGQIIRNRRNDVIVRDSQPVQGRGPGSEGSRSERSRTHFPQAPAAAPVAAPRPGSPRGSGPCSLTQGLPGLSRQIVTRSAG